MTDERVTFGKAKGDHQYQAAERSGERYLACFSPNTNNDGISTTNMVLCEVTQAVLLSLMSVGGVESDVERELILRRAAMDVVRRDKKTFEAFRVSLNRHTKEYEGKPLRTFRIVQPLNVTAGWSGLPTPIKLLGTTVEFTDWQTVGRYVDVAEWYDQLWLDSSYHVVERNPLVLTVHQRTAEDAMIAASGPFNLLRAILNMEYTGAFSFALFGRPQPLAKISVPPIAVVAANRPREQVPFKTTEDRRQYVTQTVTKSQAESLDRLLPLFTKRTTNEIRSLTVDALIGYGGAHEAIDDYMAFLVLWQVLESIALDYHTDEVPRRISALLFGADPICEDIVIAAAKLRVDLVHLGRFPEYGNKMVAPLSYVVELCIQRLLKLEKHIRTLAELRDFYNFSGKSAEQRDKIARTLRRVNAIHKAATS